MEDRKQQLLDSVMTDYSQMHAKAQLLKDEVGREAAGRELAIAITNLETAGLWLGQVQRLFDQSK